MGQQIRLTFSILNTKYDRRELNLSTKCNGISCYADDSDLKKILSYQCLSFIFIKGTFLYHLYHYDSIFEAMFQGSEK